MTTPDSIHGWDFIVPGDDADLAAEFRRHGADPGRRVHVAVLPDSNRTAVHSGDAPLPSFFASFDGPADLGRRSDEILRAEFPDGR